MKIKNKKTNSNIKTVDIISYKKMAIIIFILVLVFAAFYFLTVLIVEKNGNVNNSAEISINAKKVLMNDILNQKNEEYYVLVYSKTDENLSKYTKYINGDNFYKVDLNDILNKAFIGNETVIKLDLTDLTISDTVLINVKNSKIKNYYTSSSDIIEILKSL